MFRLEKFYAEGFNPQQYWDDRYAQEHIAGKSMGEFKKQGFWPLLEQNITKDKRYLDAGCGVGGWILFLKDQGYNVEGIDVAARTLRALTEYDPDLKVQIASMTSIPYADQSLDGVFSIGTLEYVDGKIPAAISEVNRVLKTGGLFFVEVPIANTLRRLLYIPLKRIEKVVKVALGKTPVFSTYLFRPQELQELLQANGFDVVQMHPHELPAPDEHYGLYVDWKIFRGSKPYKLNALGRVVKGIVNAISPWIASTGVVVVARKR